MSGLQYSTNIYGIPRGRVFFDALVNGVYQGEVPFGNCPGVSLTINSTKTEHYSSETGLKQKDKSITVEVNRTGKLTCDNSSVSNIALFLAGTSSTVTQAAGTAVTETITVNPGGFYQLGQTDSNPAGVRNVSNVVVKNEAGTTTFVVDTDYALDLELGRIQILKSGAIVAGKIKVTRDNASATWSRVTTGSSSEVSGRLRIIADNASGPNRDFYMPSVTLTPSGDLPIVQDGTDFTKLEFSLEVLKPANGEAIYLDGRAVEV